MKKSFKKPIKKFVKFYNDELWIIPSVVYALILFFIKCVVLSIVGVIVYPVSFLFGDQKHVKKWIEIKFKQVFWLFV